MDAASSRRASRQVFPFLLILVLGVPGVASAATLYVTPAGGGSCTGWGDPCTLQTALGMAVSGDEVWVEAGVYIPTTNVVMSPSTTDRQKTFLIPPGVAVYGGFAGTETQLSDRDPRANVTILSGDIDGDDINTDGNSIDETTADIQNDNSYHVVSLDGTGTAITSTNELDGFTITGGLANGMALPDAAGGGLYCKGTGAGSQCSPKLGHLAFRGNRAGSFGGAIYDDGTSQGVSSPSLSNVTFSGNSSLFGGAIYNEGFQGVSSPSLTNVTFSGNSSGDGGAICDHGEMGVSSPSLTNVTFSGNSSLSGGAIFNFGVAGVSSPSLTNVILWGDTAPDGPEIFNSSATASITHSVIEGSNGSGMSWDTSLGTDGGGNLDADPHLGMLQDNGGSTETVALGVGSPAIDTADDGACPATDQRGNTRPQGPHCDIGAYEAPDNTAPTVTSTSLQPTYMAPGPSSFTVTFSESVVNPRGSSDPEDVTNPANYLLVEAGTNGTFQTASCLGGRVDDDTQVPVAGVTYDSGSLTATVSLGGPLPIGTYRLFVCGTTSITDPAGNKLDGGNDSTFDFAVLAITEVPALGRAGLALLALLLAAGAVMFLRR